MKALVRAFFNALVRLYFPTIALEGRHHVPSPGTPAIFVLNHPNGLLDPLVLRLALGQPVRFLGKSTLFSNPAGRLVMGAFGGLPVYRPRDVGDGADPSRNEETFALCRQALAAGDWLALFPEGTTHSEPQMKPLKTGAARIALSAIRAADGALPLSIVPVGLMYEQKTVFRSRALAVVGPAIPLGETYQLYLTDEHAAVHALTDAIREGLNHVVIQADTRELLDGIARFAVWTADGPDARDDIAAQHRRAAQLSAAYRALVAKKPGRAEAIVSDARRYAEVLQSVGVKDPWALEVEGVRLGRTLRAFGTIAALFPLAMIGTALGWIPYRLAGRVAGRLGRDEDVRGTFKLLAGALFMPLAWGLEAAVTWHFATLWAAMLVFALGPITGYAALRFDEINGAVGEGFQNEWIRLRRANDVQGLVKRRRLLAEAVAKALRDV